MMSCGFSPTETAAYRLCVVKLYSWRKVGRDWGSAIVIRKSCARDASGWKLSRMMCPWTGSIHNGRFRWSGFKWR